jgi:hypothetical protein
MQLICPTWQVFSWQVFSWQVFGKFFSQVFLEAAATARRIYERLSLARATQWSFLHGGRLMYFVAAVLAVLAGLFYAAGNNEIGSLGVQMCQYGSTFCDHPSYVLAGAILAALWAAFVSIR